MASCPPPDTHTHTHTLFLLPQALKDISTTKLFTAASEKAMRGALTAFTKVQVSQ